MRKLAIAGAALALGLTGLAGNASAVTVGEGEGCTPGFFKNNTGAWAENADRTGPFIDPDSDLNDIQYVDENGPDLPPDAPPYLAPSFNLPEPWASTSMLEALNLRGGPGVEGKINNLLRIATASYLNAAVEIDFPLTRVQIVTAVNAAVASGDQSVIVALQETYDDLNNEECPLRADESYK